MSVEAVAAAELRAIIERVERLEEEKKAIADDIKEVMAEAKGRGYSTPIIREIVKIRKMDANERAEKEALLDTYLAALGMLPQDDYAVRDVNDASYAAEKGVDREARRKQRMSESMDDNIARSAEMVADGLISEEAHAENIALSNAVARKYGNGPLEGQIDPKLAHTIVTGLQTETGRKALAAAVDIMIEREEAEHINPETGEITNPEAKASEDNGTHKVHDGQGVTGDASRPSVGGGTHAADTSEGANANVSVDVTAGETATNSLETANEMDRTAESSFETGSEVAENARKAVPETEDGSVSHAGADESSAADERHVEATVEQRSSAPDFAPPAFLQSKPVKTARDFSPHCQKPDACGASGLRHCYSCEKAIAAESEVA